LFGGLLLLSGYFVPLALTLLAAELYNILAFHLTLASASIALALVASVL
jgi:putative oxidoreductase